MKYFFSKYDQIPSKLRIWSHLLKKFFIFCVMKDNFITVTLTLTICKIYYDDDYHQTMQSKVFFYLRLNSIAIINFRGVSRILSSM